MTPSGTHRVGYDSPEAFRRAVATRLQAEARRRDRPPQQLRREFLFQRFLARVFRVDASPWVLKGGTAMVMRMPGRATARMWTYSGPPTTLTSRGRSRTFA